MTTRRKFTPEKKAQIVLEILKEEKTIAQLSSEHEIHATQLNRWKREAIDNLFQLFVDDRKGITKMKKDYEKTIDNLYTEIGKLTTQLTQYIEMLTSADIQISMDSRGRALDNIFTERLWRSVKYEEVYLNEYSSPREARNRIRQYFQCYNTVRPHQSLDYRTPAEIHFCM